MAMCSRCRRDLDPEVDRTHRNYCTDCWRTYQRDRWNGRLAPLASSRCQWCGEEFTYTHRRPQMYCCRKHKEQATRERQRAARIAAVPVRYCAWCHLILPKSKDPRARFCSALCNNKSHRKTASKRIRIKLLERDGAWCGICGGEIDMNVKWPDLWSPSVDHIVPVSRGGSDDLDNLQLAHITCNCSRKATDLPTS